MVNGGKKDPETKKRLEPVSGFNESGPSRKFNNRDNDGNAYQGSSGNKLSFLVIGIT